ncbi:metallophosphoesterase [Phenylobacterium sp. NIBR 498073]|uniref:metallophosphoesterase n=1 Tax=Phenylobacterium sp. NIBR 498073 TaxID=3015177 RepID=UPI0022B3F5C3|nr:metallophosphoesterase [Phenylobacterium sp. NIBR 498073]WGU40149.1 metallophosphoesterase [Phenylobacterium sp. NIBR 498073]
MPDARFPDRRRLLAGLAAAPLLSGLSPPAPIVGRVLAMCDLHSAYERTGQLLAALAAEVAAHAVPHVIAIDGDIFEHGNVAAVRSGGEIDWAFLAALPKLAPTVVNLGNHDNDITTDLAEVVARLRGLGVSVVSNIVDARTGAPYAPAQVDLPLGRRTLRVVGVATNSINTYPAVSRPTLQIPVPGDWARAHLAAALAGADLAMVLSHAGVAADREILPLLPDGALMIGGHNHLLFQHRQGRNLYVHTGSWSNAYTAVTLRAAGPGEAASVPVALDGPVAPQLALLIPAVLARTLTDEERAILGTSPAALSLGDTGRATAAAIARAAGADAGFIGHTTLGTGLPAGPVSRHAFDAVVRFEGKLMVAEVSRERLAGFMARANQDRPMPLADRNGDFLYAAVLGEPAAETVRIATTDWNATNQAEYFGAKDLAFREIEGLRLKTVAAKALLGSD